MISVYWILAVFLVFFLGASIGSFSLVTVMRGHRKEDWVKGHSVCESCGKELHWWELIPTISFLILRGRCSKCKAKIEPTHFVSETGLGIIFTAIFGAYMLESITTLQALSYIVSFTVLWKNVMSDLLYFEVTSIDVLIAAIITSILNECWLPVLVMIVLDLIFCSKEAFKMLGTGDIDIFILIYATLGKWVPMVNVMFFASLLALVSYYLVIRKSEDKKIPFVPFLFAGLALTICGVTVV